MKISENTILITGGASGIGLGLAQIFSKLENEVIIVGRNINALTLAAEDVPGLKYLQCDITNSSNLERLIDQIKSKFPKLNILINNAGIQYNCDFTGKGNLTSKIEKEMKTNFIAPAKICALLIPLLHTKKESAIVNVSSVLAFAPKESAPIYCSSKAALHIFSVVLRCQLEKTPIKVFELFPPMVDTPMTAGRGIDKITPDKVAQEFITAFEKDIYEINVGKVKLLRKMIRIFPGLVKKKFRYKI
jgi:short-subunit dehydrogenase involved in D-alanine esterification of teichoic acids